MSAAQKADALGFAIMEHLGPAALTGGKMSVYDAFVLGWNAALEAEIAQVEPVDCQFQGADGRWHSFINEQHKADTIASGKFLIRELFTAPQAVNAELLEALKLCAAVCAGETSYKRGLVEALEAARAALAKAEGAKP